MDGLSESDPKRGMARAIDSELALWRAGPAVDAGGVVVIAIRRGRVEDDAG